EAQLLQLLGQSRLLGQVELQGPQPRVNNVVDFGPRVGLLRVEARAQRRTEDALATRTAVRASHEMEHDATNPPQYLDAEVDGSGRAEAVLSESKARSTQEAPRGCETEHPRPAQHVFMPS
ncbi:hypothetical protein QJQ45_015527, partial [Haematococcus lacustris]